MVKDVMVAREEATEGAVAREEVARECRLPHAMGQVKNVVELSAPEMEKQRFEEQVGIEALPKGLGSCGFLQDRCSPLLRLRSTPCSASILRLKYKRK